MANPNKLANPLIDASTCSPTCGRDVFILGAGFSKAIANEMPTMNELGAEVRNRLAEITGFSSAIPESLGNNIELWMTYLSQPQPWLQQPKIDRHSSLGGQIRHCIETVIDERTVLAAKSLAPDWLRNLIMAWHQREAIVITLNYDTLIERVAKSLRVSENTSVLQPVEIYPPYFADIASRSGAVWAPEVLRTFRLLKLHGSVNWHYSGRKDYYGETIFFSDVLEFGPTHDETARDARVQELRDMAADKETLLIPPVTEKTTYFNNETVRGLWKDAATAVREASALCIIGYSLPVSDLGMHFFLAGNSPCKETPVHVVNMDTGILDRYRDILHQSDIMAEYVQPDNPVPQFACDYADGLRLRP